MIVIPVVAVMLGIASNWVPRPSAVRTRHIVIGVVILLVASIALGGLAGQTNKEAPLGPRLQVSAFSAERLSNIDADVFDTQQKADGKVEAAVIDVAVKNVGTQTAVVSGAQFKITYAKHLELCVPEGDAITVDGRYDIKMSDPPPPVPFTIRRDLRHEIKPDSVERIVFSLGFGDVPDRGYPPWLVQVKVQLTSDASSNPLVVGTGLLATPPRRATYFGYETAVAGCPERNLKAVQEFLALPGERSTALPRLLADLQDYNKAVSQPARRVCADAKGKIPGGITAVCATWRKSELTVAVMSSNTTPESLERLDIDIELTPTFDGTDQTITNRHGVPGSKFCYNFSLQQGSRCDSEVSDEWHNGTLALSTTLFAISSYQVQLRARIHDPASDERAAIPGEGTIGVELGQ